MKSEIPSPSQKHILRMPALDYTHPYPQPLTIHLLPLGSRQKSLKSFFFFLRFYLFIHEKHRERGRDTGSIQGTRCGTWSWVSRITPWAEGSSRPLSHPGCPKFEVLYLNLSYHLQSAFTCSLRERDVIPSHSKANWDSETPHLSWHLAGHYRTWHQNSSI